MQHEIDFIRVGEESKNGDAIAMRFGNLDSQSRDDWTVVVIDGGALTSGQALVDLIRNSYGTERVDVVISTHPDSDHASGLTLVMEQLEIGELWMHRPWREEEAGSQMELGKVTDRTLKKSLEDASDIEAIALRKGIAILSPFAGESAQHPNLLVLGPTRSYYEEMIEQFDESPLNVLLRIAKGTTFTNILMRIQESWNDEKLAEPIEGTSPKNNSSVILLLHDNFQPIALFTADAGVPALTQAAEMADTHGINLQALQMIQVPHHGSRRNVGPEILNRIVGPIVQEGERKMTAVVSNAKDADAKHPSRRVSNAFTRRGAGVITTQKSGNLIHRSLDRPLRKGYAPIIPEPLHTLVEDD